MAKVPVEQRQLNSEQKQAVKFGEGTLLIIAGAGTGKTTVVTERIKHLISSGLVKPQEILALTFTEKASREMEERVDLALPYGVTQMWISTFHSFCDRVLRAEAINIGLDPAYKLMTEAETILFFRKNLFKFELKYFRPLGNPTKFISGMLQHFSRLKDEDVNPSQYLSWVKSQTDDNEELEKYQELANAYRTYEELKVKEGVADYADLISNTLKLFRTRLKILKKYQTQFKYLLIDEFQDTNFAQSELTGLLAGKRENITVVGDDDQCLPPDAKIRLPAGTKRIADISVGDLVLTAVGKGRVGVSPVTHVWKRKKKTVFITIKTRSGNSITTTANHNIFCYVPKKTCKKNWHYVYLMYRKNLGWRLGISNDLAVRLKLERSADAIVGLRAFSTEEEARFHETLWSLQYCLPTSIFKERDGVMMQGDLAKKLFSLIDTEKNARRLAGDLGVDLSRYHYILDGVTRGNSRRVVIHVHLCYRKYNSKQPKGILLSKPKVAHEVNLETSNSRIILLLKSHHINYTPAKMGVRVRFVSTQLSRIEEFAKKLAEITGGFIEVQSSLGKYIRVNEPAVVIPAGNILPGHSIPIVQNNSVVYDEIVSVTREMRTSDVYDLEVKPTHNFIANGIVVHNSIYRFRGAAVSNIIQFRKRFPKTKVIVLTKNYRSTGEILDRSYDLIQHNNPDRLEVAEKIEKKLESTRRIKGEKIKLIYMDRVENEAEEVAKIIKSLKEYEYKDFAILVRANNHAEPFVRALSRAGIPYQFLGPGQLFRQAEVKDLIAYLKVLYNFEDNVAMYRVITMDWLRIVPRDIAAVVNHAKRYGMSIFEACEKVHGDKQEKPWVAEETREKIARLVEMVHRHLELIKKETAGQILYYFLQDTGLLQQFTSYKTPKEEKMAANIAKFFDKLKSYEVDHDDASVFAVVDWIDLSMNLGESPLANDLDWTENNAVNILTIHSAKGLEFPVVFLVNLVNARFPTIERREQIPIPDELIKEILPVGDYHEEEERRLFYVGMTRARDLLYFTAANYYGEGKREKKLSPFVVETLGDKNRYPVSSNTKQLTLLDWGKQEEKEETKKIITPIDYLSYSQLETFNTCPLQYKYRYILRIPVPPSAALTFGDVMHKTVKAFYELVKLGQKPTLEKLLELYLSNWSSVGFGDKKYEEKMQRQGEELLKGFYQKGYDPALVPLDLEQSFKIKITPTLKLAGKIDRVDPLPDGKIEIIDYKTGQSPKNRDVTSDKQLTVYALAASEKGIYNKPPEKVIVSFYFFEGQEKISATRSNEQLEEIRKEIAQKAEAISRSDFKPTPGKYCDFCEFRLICEAWQ